MTSQGTEHASSALRRCALFSRLDDAALRSCVESLRARRYRRGETIFHQDDPGDALHIIEAGAVKIVLPSPGGDEDAIIATLGPGDFFGELALLDDEPRSATAVAVEPTDTLVLRRDAFRHLVDTDPGLRAALLAGLAGELRRLTHHVGELHFLDLPGRLAQRLVRLARAADPAARGEVRLSWPYSQSELASMIGGTRQTVNRLLSGLAADGLVQFDAETLVIPDLDRLERVAER